jgi:hypothetical protein
MRPRCLVPILLALILPPVVLAASSVRYVFTSFARSMKGVNGLQRLSLLCFPSEDDLIPTPDFPRAPWTHLAPSACLVYPLL